MARRRHILIVSGGLVFTAAAVFGFIAWESGVLEYYAAIRAAKARHPPVDYVGDGIFVDTGPDAGIQRFVVDFGSVVLTSDGRYAYEARGLPMAHFVPSIVVSKPLVLSNAEPVRSEWGMTSARLQVFGDDDLIIDVHRPLNEWTRSEAIGSEASMLYLPEATFDAAPTRAYRLVLSVSGKVPQAPSARLVMSGGGWQDPITNELYSRTNP